MDPRIATVSGLVTFADTFTPFDNDNPQSMDGLIVDTNRGMVAMLYAKSTPRAGKNLLSKSLDYVIGRWERGAADFGSTLTTNSSLQYSIHNLSDSTISKLNGTPFSGSDRLLSIISMDARELNEEVTYAKKMLTALGLRSIGPVSDEDEAHYDLVTKRIIAQIKYRDESSTVRDTVSMKVPIPSPVNVAASKEDAVSHGTRKEERLENSIESTAIVPLGATREWLSLKAIAIMAGVPKQPSDCISLYKSTHYLGGAKSGEINPAIWDVEESSPLSCKKVDGVLEDAKAVRVFLLEQVDMMSKRFEEMSRKDAFYTWGTDIHKHITDNEKRREADVAAYKRIADSLDSLRIQTEHSLSADTTDDLSMAFQVVADNCKALGERLQWAAKGFTVMSYTARLLDIIEQGAVFMEKESVRRLHENESQIPSDAIRLFFAGNLALKSGYGLSIEGKLIKEGLLPASMSGKFPCIEQDDGSKIVVQGGTVERMGDTMRITTPKLPQVSWLHRTTDDNQKQAKNATKTENTFNDFYAKL
jgi:hypothetical protein